MHPEYFQTRFRLEEPIEYPSHFVIITGYATTGERWSQAENDEADRRLKARLDGLSYGAHRIVGYSPTTLHAEPGWLVEMSVEEAHCMGEEFRQDAIYFVEHDTLWVAECRSREKAKVGSFRSRVDSLPDPRLGRHLDRPSDAGSGDSTDSSIST